MSSKTQAYSAFVHFVTLADDIIKNPEKRKEIVDEFLAATKLTEQQKSEYDKALKTIEWAKGISLELTESKNKHEADKKAFQKIYDNLCDDKRVHEQNVQKWKENVALLENDKRIHEQNVNLLKERETKANKRDIAADQRDTDQNKRQEHIEEIERNFADAQALIKRKG